MLNRVLLTILFFAITIARAQDSSGTVSKVIISSPTAASLGKYGDIPVSYHTGLLNIGIPIYTVNSNSLKLPISLSYHAGGIKVQENSSWVGAGWSLAAGGVITRTVNGAPDDKGTTSGSFCTDGYYSGYGYHNYMWRYFPSAAGAAPDGYTADDFLFAPGKKDGEPDLYFFNFNGYTGKFYFNDCREPVLVPGTDLRIRPDYTEGTGFGGFIVTTADGVQYYFGKTGNNGTVDPIEITVPGTLQYNYANSNAAVSSWWLNKIISSSGQDSITFEYTAESYSYHTLSMFPISSAFVPYFAGPSNIEYNLVKNFTNGVRLSKIKFTGGSVIFTPVSSARLDLSGGFLTDGSLYDADNTEAKALGSITIKNDSGTLCKKDTFYYNYWYDSTSSLTGVLNTTYSFANLHNDRYRLRLDSLQEISCDNSIKIPTHKFTYFTEPVPRRLNFGIDHWGFYNGVNNNNTLIPTVTIKNNTLTTITGANRDAAWPAMRGGALKKIDFPTGGYTIMDFEPHDTWCEYDTFSLVPRVSRGAGHTLSTQNDTLNVTLSGNSYHITLSNSAVGNVAQVTITRTSDNTLEFAQTADAGVTKDVDAVLAGGNYQIITRKDYPGSAGNGCSLNMSEWIPHSLSGNMLVGGLRIKSLINNDNATSDSIVTNYNYRVAQNSSGHSTSTLYSKPVYIQTARNDVFKLVWGAQGNCSPNGCASCDGSSEIIYFKSPSSIRPMATSQGAHIGYNEVFVSQPANGYSVYRYYGSNVWDSKIADVCTRYIVSNNCNTSIPNYPEAPPVFEPMRGELKYEGHFTDSGNIVKDIWHYPRYVQEGFPTPGIISSSIASLQTFTMYDLVSYRKDRDSVEETAYIPPSQRMFSGDDVISSTVTNTTYYRSKFHHQPSKQEAITSTKDTLTTYLQNSFDFVTPSCLLNDSTSFYLNLLHNDTVNLMSEISTCSPQVAVGLSNCRYGVYQKYRRIISLHRIDLINYWRRNFSDSAKSACLASRKSGADYLLKPMIQLQEDFNNPPIEVTHLRNNKVLKSTFSIYKYANDPATTVFPWVNQTLNTRVPVTNFSQASITNASIPKDNRYRDEISTHFNRGNMVDLNPKDGVTISHIWDYGNTLPIAETIGTADSTTAHCSFEAEGTGNWTIGSTARLDTQAITGKKSYQLSAGNISKSGLVDTTEYYLSYWTKNSSAFSIAGTLSIPQQGKTLNSWTCFVHLIKGVSQITLSGTGIIDELRLFPKIAQMKTYTYDLMLGITSQCDSRNEIVYYEYDILGRLKFIRDKEKNILKSYSYKYQEQQ